MIILLPVLVLAFGAVLTALLYKFKIKVLVIWGVAIGTTSIVTISSLVMRAQAPLVLSLAGWSPMGISGDRLVLTFDALSFPYIFCAEILLLAILFTAAVRVKYQTNPYAWAGSMGLASVAILSLLSAEILGFIFTWTILDLVELALLLSMTEAADGKRQAALAFFIRFGGTLLAVAAMVVSRSGGVWLSLIQPGNLSTVLLVLAVGFRLGILPLHIAYSHEVQLRRGLGLMLRMASPLTALMLLARLPVAALSPATITLLMTFAIISALYGALRWAAGRDVLEVRRYWLLAMTGLAFLTFLRGDAAASRAWGVAMLCSGSILFLYTVRDRKLLFIPAVGLLALTGLPFTPLAAGWTGLLNGTFSFAALAAIVILALLLIGYIRMGLQPGDDFAPFDPWIKAVYPIGLILLAIAPWVVALMDMPDSFPVAGWWGAVGAVLMAASVEIYLILKRIKGIDAPVAISMQPIAQLVMEKVGKFTTMGWFFKIFWHIFRAMQSLIAVFTGMFEGAGGILWTLVLLALLLSLLQGRATP